MLIGVISDTHDNVEEVQRAVELFTDRGIDTVIHCGDVIAPPVVPFFDGLDVHAVLGNNDGELDGLESAFRDLSPASKLHGRFAALTLDGLDVAALHGEDLEEVERLAATGEYDLVCHGHHHEAVERSVGEATVLNPGALFQAVPDEEHSVAIVDTDDGAIEFVNVAD
ncbi:metallophosphoesterase [Salinarchaeum chitinilyticum]